MNFEELSARLELPLDTFMELVDLYLTSTPSGMQRISDGLKDGDAEAISSGAHEIKGASANLGFTTLSELAAAIETRAHEDRTVLTSLAGKLAEGIEDVRAAISAQRKAE